ncbi:MAG TPA: PKD domain-containing protein, partial [Niastella sp.]
MAHFYKVMALAVLLSPVLLNAQERITAQPVSPQSVPALKNIFKKYAFFELNKQALDQYVKKAAAQGEINLELDLPGYMSFPINMHQHDIMSTDYKLAVGSPQGRQEFSKPTCMTYAGVLTGQGNSDVRLTITNDLIYGILSGNNKSYFIEPVRYLSNQAKENLYVVYETTDVIPDNNNSCGISEVMTRVNTLDVSNARVEGFATGTCKQIELAIASDDSMFFRYRTVADVQTHNISVANIMAYFYGNTQLGSYYVEFTIKGQYVSTAAASNALSPVTTTQSADVLLANFRTWGNAGNFGFTYDIGVYWTTKNIYATSSGVDNYGVIGLATISGACGLGKYQILEDFSSNGLALALMAAHETGHNLSAQHDASGALYIMAPAINTSNTAFSATSITSMTSFVTNASCFSACTNTVPTAQYTASAPAICAGSNVAFTNYSSGQVTGISWAFQDGTPATSTAEAPTVTFSTPGLKTVTLTATNANGNNSITKSIFVGSSLTGAGCRVATAGNGEDVGLSSFSLQNISNTIGIVYI